MPPYGALLGMGRVTFAGILEGFCFLSALFCAIPFYWPCSHTETELFFPFFLAV